MLLGVEEATLSPFSLSGTVINKRAPDVRVSPRTASLIITGCGKDLLREIVRRDAKKLFYITNSSLDLLQIVCETTDMNAGADSGIALECCS
jgi:hypothetical protein